MHRLEQLRTNNPKLRQLEIWGCSTDLAEAIMTNTVLTGLVVHIWSAMAEVDVPRIVDILQVNSSLQGLSVLNIEPGYTRFIAEALAVNCTLRYLKLSSNLEPRYIADMLQVNTSLARLDLAGTKLDSEGTGYIATALRVNTNLRCLHLGANNLGKGGAAHIAELLQTNSTLEELNLSGSRLGVEEARLIGEGLALNSTLTHLNIADNRLQFKGLQHLATALRYNTSLSYLEIYDNGFSRWERQSILNLFQQNAGLTRINTDMIARTPYQDFLNRNRRNRHLRISTLFHKLWVNLKLLD